MRRLLLSLAALSLLAFAAPATAKIREVGIFKNAPFPEAGCPDNCQAIGGVTGFQVQIGNHKKPYSIWHKGKIVAFTIKLGKPNAEQSQFFTNLFGGEPQARLTLLKPIKRPKQTYQVKAMSEVFDLGPYLGSSPTFALDRPLRVSQPGWVVALTVPTWAPSFAVNLGNDQAWRSPRPAEDCDGTTRAVADKHNDKRRYRCYYKTARLLYSATFVRDPVPTNDTATAK